ncbi:ATP-binding protein [Mycobacterium sp. PS03-16]|uniref:ATP-binding protein n=1 Tax=Mycobacterium sp. PS03-16 TaxID=2559611 RepID=UPI001072FD22|nr:ATP-binding protein [Mycobacterium sp. PS03-16]TFV58166.1 ATP-binding protein [Mycobacterium sp. PS03-16]
MSASTRYLLERAAEVERRIRALVAHRRSYDPAPDDPFRGLYLSDEMVDSLLTPPPVRAPVAEPAADRSQEDVADEIRLRRLARTAALTGPDAEILLICLLPDLDSRFERLYGYLNDDVTRRRASIGLALELAGLSPMDATARARLTPGAPLVDHSLLLVEDGDRPFLTRGLRVPDRVTAHLLGDDTPDPALTELLATPCGHRNRQSAELAAAFAAGQRLCYLRESAGCTAVAVATDALSAAGYPVLCCDAARSARADDLEYTITVLGREAVLREAALVISPVEAFGARTGAVIHRLVQLPVPVVLTGAVTWDPDWSSVVPLLTDVSRLTVSERLALWRGALGPLADTVDAGDVAAQFAFGPRQVAAAMSAADAVARLSGRPLGAADLRHGARSQNAAGLERLARRIEPAVSWDDIVLPARVLAQLRELTTRARTREIVLTDWRMRPGGGRGGGVTALFAGDSGTGKTMAAEVIAGDLGLDLYTVNLATVVDKYVGETEKNLERIFTEAARVSAVLLFDEADAIFGKRSEVRDAHDRYANIESAYLLQRMETFDGLAILATNFRANLDDAFTRRLDLIVDFPLPDESARLALWQSALRPPVPVRDDLRLADVATAYELSGGNIRSAAVTAAYLAAARQGPVGPDDVTAAIQQEFRKLGRLLPAPPSESSTRLLTTRHPVVASVETVS